MSAGQGDGLGRLGAFWAPALQQHGQQAALGESRS